MLTEVYSSVTTEHLHRYSIAMELAKGKAVLDIASGEGYGANLLATVAHSVVGVDIDSIAVKHATKKYRKENLKFEVGDCNSIPLPDNSIDLAVSFETIEHIADHRQFIAELRRVLRPDGILIISTPNADVYHHGQEPNPWHVKELTKPEFLHLLKTEFRNTELATQRFLTGSVVVPDPAAKSQGNYQHTGGSFDGFHKELMRTEGTYIIAIATNAEQLPVWTWGSFMTSLPIMDDETQQLQNQLEAIRNSSSWRLTAPLRWVVQFLHVFKKANN